MSQITQQDIHDLGNKFNTFTQHQEKLVKDHVSAVEATFKAEQQKISEAVLSKYDELAATNKQLQSHIDTLATQMNRVGNAYGDSAKEPNEKQALELSSFNRSKMAVWVGKGMATPEKVAPISHETFDSYKKSFGEMIRRGVDSMDREVVAKSLSVGVDPDGGGWLLPPQRATQIVTRVFETSPMRQISTVESISAHEYEVPMDPNRLSTGGWVSEKKPRTATTTPTIEMMRIVPGEIYAEPPVTDIMLEDSAYDIENWLANKVAQSFSLDENTAFVSGNGVGRPFGFLTFASQATAGGLNADGTNRWGELQVLHTGTAGQFTYLALVNMLASFRSEIYTNNLTWLVKRSTVPSLLTLQNQAGQYIFQPVINGQFNGTPLLGQKLLFANDMPGQAAGAIAMALGDFSRGYTIVDRVGLSTRRDNLTAKPFTLFYVRKRVGGSVTDFDAIKLLQLS